MNYDNLFVNPLLSVTKEFSAQNAEILTEVGELKLDFATSSKSFLNEPKIAIIESAQYKKITDILVSELEKLDIENLEIVCIPPENFIAVDGQLGAFNLRFCGLNDTNDGREIEEVEEKMSGFSQVVFFTKFSTSRRYGIHLANEYQNAAELALNIKKFLQISHHPNFLQLNEKTCEYIHAYGKNEYCKKCVEACKFDALCADVEKREITLSHIDCVRCGECVSVCPNEAILAKDENLYTITQFAKLYSNKVVVLCDEASIQEILPAIKAQNRDDVLPLPLKQVRGLNVTKMLTLIQESSAPLVIYSSTLVDSKVTTPPNLYAEIDELNEISHLIFGRDLVMLVRDEDEFNNAIKDIRPMLELAYKYNISHNENIRGVFGARMLHWIKNQDFGKADMFNIASIQIGNACTLCMGCVEVCREKALTSSQGIFELNFNSSLCTNCGFCADICPEQAIALDSGLYLQKSSFTHISKIKDEAFKCTECDKIIGTKKSIDKVKAMLGAYVNPNIIELCSDCKVNVMFGVRDAY